MATTIITGVNKQSTLTVLYTKADRIGDAYEIGYEVHNQTIEPLTDLGKVKRTVTIINTEEQLDIDGNVVVPADDALDVFKSQITSDEELAAISEVEAIQHGQQVGVFVEYVDPTDDFWDGETDAAPPIDETDPWVNDVFIAAGAVRKLDGTRYRAKFSHVTNTGNYYPPNLVVWTAIQETGTQYDVWVQPTGAHDAYPLNAIVHYPDIDSPLYKSLIDNNVWVPTGAQWEPYTP